MVTKCASRPAGLWGGKRELKVTKLKSGNRSTKVNEGGGGGFEDFSSLGSQGSTRQLFEKLRRLKEEKRRLNG